jgi:hypothetical protein
VNASCSRDDLAADRVVGVLGVDQADEVRRDIDPELVGRRQSLALLVGQLEDLLDLIELVDAVRELPAPVVPLLVGDVLVDRRPVTHGRLAVGSDGPRRVRQIDERRLRRDAGGVLVCDRGLDLLGIQPVPTSSVDA